MALAVLACSAPGRADEVYLKGGGQLSGKITSRTATTIEVEVGAGRIGVPASSVLRIEEGRSPLHEFEERAGALAASDVEGWLALGDWARAKGLGERTVTVRHALRNAWIPIVTVLGLSFGQILSGTIIVETVFAWPGIGRYLVSGVYGRDFPVVQATVLLIATSFVVANLITDLWLVYIDPRIRYE